MKTQYFKSAIGASMLAVMVGVLSFGLNIASGAPAEAPPGAATSPTFSGVTITGDMDIQGSISDSTGPVVINDTLSISDPTGLAITIGGLTLYGSISNPYGAMPKPVTIDDELAVTGNTDLQGELSNSTGDLAINDNVVIDTTKTLTVDSLSSSLPGIKPIKVNGDIEGTGGNVKFNDTVKILNGNQFWATGPAIFDEEVSLAKGFYNDLGIISIRDSGFANKLNIGHDGLSGVIAATNNLIKINSDVNLMGAANSWFNIFTNAYNAGDSILTLKEGTDGKFGFSLEYDGNGTNNFNLKRFNGDTVGSTVMSVNRGSDNAVFAGGLDVAGNIFNSAGNISIADSVDFSLGSVVNVVGSLVNNWPGFAVYVNDDLLVSGASTLQGNVSSSGKITATGGFGTINKITGSSVSVLAGSTNAAYAYCPGSQLVESCGYYSVSPDINVYRLAPYANYCYGRAKNNAATTQTFNMYAVCLDPSS